MQAPITPVRSAKDAINAMYAQGNNKGLGDYLATSAKEIINAGGRATGDSKSATNLHRGSINHRVESSRPSASGLLKTARPKTTTRPSDTSAAMDPLARRSAPAVKPRATKKTAPATTPVVKTSLKLAPKKSPAVISPQNIQRNTSRRTIDMTTTRKGKTSLEQLLAGRQAKRPKVDDVANDNAAESIKTIRQAALQTTAKVAPKTVSRPKMRAPRGLMQDVIRPAGHPGPSAARPAQPAPADNHPNTRSGRPIDSIKRRFRPAPKDYIAHEEVQEEAYAGYEVEDQTAPKPPVEIYGMMDEEPTGKRDGLGVVEDYNPTGKIHEQKVAQGSGTAAPDNSKHILGGQSPFFLKSVNVEKRPLSDSPHKSKSSPSEGTLYEQSSSEPIGRKNVYAEKETKKPLPTKPTVIIPASRRSKAPLIFLLILTVILGAAVGAFIYLCFFQYLE